MIIPDELRFKADVCKLIVHKVYDANCNAMYQMVRDGDILVKLDYRDAMVWLDGYGSVRS